MGDIEMKSRRMRQPSRTRATLSTRIPLTNITNRANEIRDQVKIQAPLKLRRQITYSTRKKLILEPNKVLTGTKNPRLEQTNNLIDERNDAEVNHVQVDESISNSSKPHVNDVKQADSDTNTCEMSLVDQSVEPIKDSLAHIFNSENLIQDYNSIGANILDSLDESSSFEGISRIIDSIALSKPVKKTVLQRFYTQISQNNDDSSDPLTRYEELDLLYQNLRYNKTGLDQPLSETSTDDLNII